MYALLNYLHTCFIRSYRYVPSTFIFLAGICLVYSIIPNPIMPSYAFSTSFLFLISAMLCYSFIDIESTNQEAITLLHTGSLIKLSIAKLIYIWLFTIPLAIFAVAYPAIFDRFDSMPTISQLFYAFICHIISSLLAITITCWFSKKNIESRLISFLLLSLLVVITFAVPGIEQSLPHFVKNVVVVIPPHSKMIDVMMNEEKFTLLQKWLAVAYSMLYSIMISGIYLFFVSKRRG